MDAERAELVAVLKAMSPCSAYTGKGVDECPRCVAKNALDAYDLRKQEETQSGDPDQWMYLSDRTGHACLVNLESGAVLSTREVNVTGNCGMRRQRIRWRGHNTFEELPEFVRLDTKVVALLRKHDFAVNSWNVDPMHAPTEQQSDDPAWQEETHARIMDTLQLLPYTAKLQGIQLRHLLYYSDGDYDTQQRYLSVCPQPNYGEIWDKNWELNSVIANAPTQDEVIDWDREEDGDSDNPLATGEKQLLGQPLLWNGPAIMIRLLLDDQQAAFGGCRIYLDPTDLRVISSDWCQRAGRDMYSQGIDLQVREYDLPTWLISSCVPRAMAEGAFKPKTSKIKVVQLAKIKKAKPVPSLAEALKKHESAVNRHLKTMTVEETLAQLRADLHTEAGIPQRKELHKVPMCLVPEFTASTRKLYENAVSDSSIVCNADSMGLTCYTKAPTVYVRAEYLMIDEDRVRAKAAALAKAATPETAVKKPLKSKGKTKTKKAEPQTAEEVEAKFLTMCGQQPA